MWNSNQDVRYVYATHGSQQAWAMFVGMSGWKRVRQGSADGVGNITELLSTAKAHGRKVNVYLQNDQIERALML